MHIEYYGLFFPPSFWGIFVLVEVRCWCHGQPNQPELTGLGYQIEQVLDQVGWAINLGFWFELASTGPN